MLVSMLGFRLLVLQSLSSKLLSHSVDIESQFASFESRSHSGFLLFACDRLLDHIGRGFARYDADAIVVRDDYIARSHRGTRAHDRYIHAAQRLFHRSLGADCTRPDWKLHRSQIA